jgi:hypothetical protein
MVKMENNVLKMVKKWRNEQRKQQPNNGRSEILVCACIMHGQRAQRIDFAKSTKGSC